MQPADQPRRRSARWDRRPVRRGTAGRAPAPPSAVGTMTASGSTNRSRSHAAVDATSMVASAWRRRVRTPRSRWASARPCASRRCGGARGHRHRSTRAHDSWPCTPRATSCTARDVDVDDAQPTEAGLVAREGHPQTRRARRRTSAARAPTTDRRARTVRRPSGSSPHHTFSHPVSSRTADSVPSGAKRGCCTDVDPSRLARRRRTASLERRRRRACPTSASCASAIPRHVRNVPRLPDDTWSTPASMHGSKQKSARTIVEARGDARAVSQRVVDSRRPHLGLIEHVDDEAAVGRHARRLGDVLGTVLGEPHRRRSRRGAATTGRRRPRRTRRPGRRPTSTTRRRPCRDRPARPHRRSAYAARRGSGMRDVADHQSRLAVAGHHVDQRSTVGRQPRLGEVAAAHACIDRDRPRQVPRRGRRHRVDPTDALAASGVASSRKKFAGGATLRRWHTASIRVRSTCRAAAAQQRRRCHHDPDRRACARAAPSASLPPALADAGHSPRRPSPTAALSPRARRLRPIAPSCPLHPRRHPAHRTPSPTRRTGSPVEKGPPMWPHPYITDQLVHDRHETLRRQAGASRLRRAIPSARGAPPTTSVAVECIEPRNRRDIVVRPPDTPSFQEQGLRWADDERPRSQPRSRTRPRHRERRPCRGSLGGSRRQARRRRRSRRRDAHGAVHRADGRLGRHRRGREGRSADAVQRRAHRRRQHPAGRRGGRPDRRHQPDRTRPRQRHRRDRGQRPRQHVRPGALLLHEQDRRRARRRRLDRHHRHAHPEPALDRQGQGRERARPHRRHPRPATP